MTQKCSKMTQNEQKTSKNEFFSRSFCQYSSTFEESDKTRYTKASNVLDTSGLLCLYSENYANRDLMNSSKYCEYQLIV